MNQIALPPKIYKYQPSSIQAISNLAAGQLWFADPFTFNDPFDCALEAIEHAVTAPFAHIDTATCIEILQQGNLPPQFTAELLKLSGPQIQQLAANVMKKQIPTLANRGVCCFSTCNRNMLMWGHYAECHRGYCLEFTTEFEPFNDPSRLHQVQYHDRFPTLDLERLAHGDLHHFLELLQTKAKCWDYEQEWRFIHQEKCIRFGYPRRCLTAVYFGAKMPEELTHLIGTAVENTPTKLFRAKLVPGEFKLDFEPVEYTSINYRDDATHK